MSFGTGSNPESRLPTPGISSGCRAPRNSNAPSSEIAGSMPPTRCENRARLDHVELGRDVDRALQIVGTPAESIRELEEDPAHFLRLLLLERDDVVVDLDRVERFEIDARAARGCAVHDPRNRGAMFGADDDHVAAVAIGDDLVLQVFRRVAPAHVRLERRPQLRPLAPQPVADARERRARVVGHLARRIDLPADFGDFALERRDPLDQLPQDREHRRRIPHRRARVLDRFEKVGEAEQASRLERAPLDVQRLDDCLEVRRRAEREAGMIAEEAGPFGCRALGGEDGGHVRHRTEVRQAFGAGRRHRQIDDRRHDLIKLERAQGTWVHVVQQVQKVQ